MIETERLILRPWEEPDAEALFKYASDPDVGPIAGWPPHISVENSLEIIRTVFAAPETYAVVLKDIGKPVGCCGIMFSDSLHTADIKKSEAEIGYWIGKPYWGQGLIPEAVLALLARGFNDLHLDAVWCGYYHGNTRSKRVIEKCGFTFHHTNKDIVSPLGDKRTEHLYIMTKEDYYNMEIKRKKLVYLHGFGSSAASGTVQTLRELLPDFEVVAPDIPVDPAEALPLLRELCMNEMPDVVVGTSMGGMYAQQMRGYNRICVNPAFEMSKKSKMLTIGTHEYFKPRKDGTTHFKITPEIILHHAEMEEHQFDGITNQDRKQVWGMFADNDQQVNGESLFLQHYSQIVHFCGGHRMDDRVIHDVLVPLIRAIVK